MDLLDREEFAAKRRGDQDKAIEALTPKVSRALKNYGSRNWFAPLLTAAHKMWNDMLREDSGNTINRDEATWAKLKKQITDSLAEQGKPTPGTANTIATWMSTMLLNNSAAVAAQHDDDELGLEWVTMHDGDVRVEHKHTDGQVRPVGEKYDVSGTPMAFPGDTTAPIELWINCRCMLRPTHLGSALTAAWHNELAEKVGDDMADEEMPPEPGAIPFFSVLAPEGVKSGDGRRFSAGALRSRPLPLPFTWQKTSDDGHRGNVTVAKMDKVVRKDGEMRATGSFLATPEADEVLGLIADFGRFGVSIDADDATFELDEEDGTVEFTSARIASACIVPIPAFSQAWIQIGVPDDDFMDGDEITGDEGLPDESLVASALQAVDIFKDLAPGKTEDGPGWLTHPVDTERLRHYWTKGEGAAKIGWGSPGDFNRCRINLAKYIKPEFLNGYCANRHYDALGFWPGRPVSAEVKEFSVTEISPSLSLVAAVGKRPPMAWFMNPEFDALTPLTVTDEGRIFGHLAQWESCHIGNPEGADVCTVAPYSVSKYAYFMTGEVLTDEGSVAVGNITMGGPHAAGQLRSAAAAAHYDNTCVAVADVTVGEDEFGIWFAGRVRNDVKEDVIDALRASGGLSGDWRTIGGNYELIAALAVNVPGFPVPRIAASVAKGRQVSLVAAGYVGREEARVEKDIEIEPLLRALAKYVAENERATKSRKDRMAALAARVNGSGDGV